MSRLKSILPMLEKSASHFTNRNQSAAQRNRHDLSHAGFAGDLIYFLMDFRLKGMSFFIMKLRPLYNLETFLRYIIYYLEKEV